MTSPSEITEDQDRQIIESLGGAVVVAQLCECTPQAVSQWYGFAPNGKKRKIPKSRRLHLTLARPDVFLKFNESMLSSASQ